MRSTYSLFTILAYASFACSSSAVAQSVNIKPADALQHVGENVTVQMTVKNVGRAKDMISLTSTQSFKDDDCLIVRITAEAQAAMVKAGIKKPAGYFANKTIKIAGTIEKIKPGGLLRPVIFVKSADQISVVTNGNTPDSVPTISTDQVAQHVGKSVRLIMTVAAVSGGTKFVNLNSKRPASTPGNVQIRISTGVQAAFKKAGIEIPMTSFVQQDMRDIEVTGVIVKTDRGGFTIDVESPDDITLVLKSQRGTPTIAELPNQQIELFLTDERRFAGVTILEVKTGDDADSISSLTVSTPFSKSKQYTAEQIEDIYVDGVPMDLEFNPDKNALFVDQQKRKQRLEVAEQLERRLLAKHRTLWPRLTDAEQQTWLTTHREFVESVKTRYPQLRLRTMENDFYILVSDFDPNTMRKHLDYLDKLYRRMCIAYGIPVGRNMWCGKCVIAAFKHQADFMKFESEVMKNPRDDLHTSGGICHSGPTGRVTIAVYKGKTDAGTFSHKLVHETSHGFVWRYRSNAALPSWLNEGMADWIAFFIVKSPGNVDARNARAAQAAQQSGTLGGIFDMPRISKEYYGASSIIVDILLKIDPDKFQQFFDGIKTGLEAEDALREAYGFGFKELAGLYGRRIGRPDLKP